MDDEQRQHLEDLRRRHQRRLRELERQTATFGLSTPPEIRTEMEDIGAEIARIETELKIYVATPDRDAPSVPHDFRSNLPAQTTSLIGREQEVAETCNLLRQPNVRLLTLTGIGGIGKTRLGLQAASVLFDDFPDGVFFVALASISDPGLVMATVAQTLGVIKQGSRPLGETLKDYLHEKQLLLLLDNFEQVTDAAPVISELLASAAGLKVLVTSRVILHLYGEREFAVPPLALPDLKEVPLIERLTQYEAVRLFIERSRAVRADFAVTNDNAPAVAAICVRLDGLPLAIELAAARSKLFAPQALLGRLDSRLKLLTGGSRNLPARQQTLRNAITWSYDLLDAAEQTLFVRLGVFVGGWTIEAAETVCGDPPSSILDELTVLLDNSLLQQSEGDDGEPRFTMLETIHEYALERLAERGETEILRQRHAALFLALAEQAEPELRGSGQMSWANRLEQEHDNLRAALEWALSGGAAEVGVRLAGALAELWRLRGHYSEGCRWLEAAVGARIHEARTGGPGALVSDARAAMMAQMKALQGLGGLRHDSGEPAVARAPYEEGLALAQQLGDKSGIARSLDGLGLLALHQDDYALAQALHEESLALWRDVGDKDGTALAFYHLGHIALGQDDYPLAHSRYAESLALWRAVGNRSGMAYAINNLGLVAMGQNDYALARALFEQSLALWRDAGHKQGISIALGNLGLLAHEQGDLARATALLEESLALHRDMGDQYNIADSLGNLGSVMRDLGDFAAAQRLLEDDLMQQRASDDKPSIALILAELGNVALGQGDYARARLLHEESLALARALPSKNELAVALDNLGDLALAEGNHQQAAQLFEESLTLQAEVGDHSGVAEGLEGLAAVSAAQGDPERAAQLWGAAEALREALGTPLLPLDRVVYDRHVAAARAQVDPASFAAAWAEGQAMTLEQAVADALQRAPALQQPRVAPAPAGPPPTTPAYPAGLTAREVEVLRLVAEGLTDAQVAERLVVSPHTVHAHLRAIYGKLSVTSRAAATRFAVDHQLL